MGCYSIHGQAHTEHGSESGKVKRMGWLAFDTSATLTGTPCVLMSVVTR
jgi:hypothetical protein